MANKQKLTNEEIEDVVNALPPILAALPKVANKVREQIQNKIRLQLKDIMMIKTPESLKKLKEMIVKAHYNSLAQPGEPVGMRAAEAFGQPTTQMALSVFHSAGAASSVAGIDAIKELYQLKKENRKNDNTTIHFKNKDLIYEDVIDLRRKINGILLKDVLERTPEPRRYSKKTEPYWYQLYLDVSNRRLPIDRNEILEERDTRHNFLRLKFNKNKLFNYNLTTVSIAEKLNQDSIFCLPSPTDEGIVDIFVDSAVVMSYDKIRDIRDINISPYNVVDIFILVFLIPDLLSTDTIINDGVDKISDIFPVETKVYTVVENRECIDKEIGLWRMLFDKINIILRGVPLQKLYKLMELCGIKISKITDDYIEVISENDPFKTMDNIVKSEEEKLKVAVEKEKKDNIFKRRNVPEILRTGTYVYAKSNGTNLIKILGHPLIDTSTTTCTNPHEIVKILGIEAARNYLIRAYITVISENSHYLDPRHALITADFQTYKGVLLQISPRGAARQNTGPLAKASFEQPIEAFVDAAAFGKFEDIKNTSSSIFVGKRMILGTGSFKARIDVEALNKAEKVRLEMRQNNPNFSDCINDTMKENLIETLQDNTDFYNFGDDTSKQHGVYGVDGFDFMNETNEVVFKPYTPVQKVIICNYDLPGYIKDIISINIPFDAEVITTSPKISRFGNPSVNTAVGKPGSRAIPRMSPSQILFTNNITKSNNENDDIDDMNF